MLLQAAPFKNLLFWINYITYLRQFMSFLSLSLLILFFNLTTVYALPVPNFCFAHSDDGDTLHTMLFDGTAQQAAPNASGVPNIEAIAFNPSTEILYAVDANRLGTLNYNFADATNGGRFTAISTVLGTVNGSAGTVSISDVDSMAFDPITNILYGVDRSSIAPDKLIIINSATGTADPNAFGTNIGYIEVTDNNAATTWDEDIDDLAIDPSDAQLYAVANSGGAGDHLITLDRDTGALTDIGVLTTNDMEGLGFFNDGTLYGTTGAASSIPTDRDALWRINTSNANATKIANFVSDADYEAVACLVGDPNNKSGIVFNDANSNGVFDAGESRVVGVTIEIYRDRGIVLGAIDSADRQVGTSVTNVGGTYEFDMAAVGEFLLQVDISSLPAGISISDNIEIATFNNCNPGAAPFDDFGCREPNNNFPSNIAGFPPTPMTPPPTTPRPTNQPSTVSNNAQSVPQFSSADISISKTVQPENLQIGDTLSFTITVTNPTSQAISNLTLTDNLPDIFSLTNATTTQGIVSIDANLVTVNIATLQAQETLTVIITAEALRAAFAPETCNQVSIGNSISNQVCPNIFPTELPQTGQSPFESLRSLSVILLIGLGTTGIFARWRKSTNP
jgi:uncharacterized repeat protein (TIGR01451 family)